MANFTPDALSITEFDDAGDVVSTETSGVWTFDDADDLENFLDNLIGSDDDDLDTFLAANG